MSRTTIVIPCYNEAQRLDVEAFRAYASSTPDVWFLFVDDGSTDDTVSVLRTMRDADPDVFDVLSLARNCGKAEAVRRGFLKVFENAPDYVAFWDADLATPLEAIGEFRDLLDSRPQFEVVVGSRVNLLGRSVNRNLARHYVGRVFATVANAVLWLPIYDTQCGAKMFRINDDVVGIFQQPFISKWIFDVEIIARLLRSRRGTSLPPVREIMYEHPLMVWHDVKGSKIKLRHSLSVAIDLLRIWIKYMRR